MLQRLHKPMINDICVLLKRALWQVYQTYCEFLNLKKLCYKKKSFSWCLRRCSASPHDDDAVSQILREKFKTLFAKISKACWILTDPFDRFSYGNYGHCCFVNKLFI